MCDAQFGRSTIRGIAVWRITLVNDPLDLLVLQLVMVCIGVWELCNGVSCIYSRNTWYLIYRAVRAVTLSQ